MGNSSPLIFIHKGNIKDPPDYLRSTLSVARHYNPDGDIYLLGDHITAPYAHECGVKFAYYEDYATGADITTFNKVFQSIIGPQCGQSPEWVKFVFERWFYMYNFATSKGLEKFWTFDSDTLVLTNLNSQEYKFKDYDCTEQCNGACMNGFINNMQVVKGYLLKINELFQDDIYLKTQRDEILNIHPTYSLTEMRAYCEYKKSGCSTKGSLKIHKATTFKSILLQTIIDNEVFEPCLVQDSKNQIIEDQPDNGFEMENGFKKLYLREGNIYLKHLNHASLVKANSLNLSNLPPFSWQQILSFLFTHISST